MVGEPKKRWLRRAGNAVRLVLFVVIAPIAVWYDKSQCLADQLPIGCREIGKWCARAAGIAVYFNFFWTLISAVDTPSPPVLPTSWVITLDYGWCSLLYGLLMAGWILAHAVLGLMHRIIATAFCMFSTHPGLISAITLLATWAYYSDEDP